MRRSVQRRRAVASALGMWLACIVLVAGCAPRAVSTTGEEASQDLLAGGGGPDRPATRIGGRSLQIDEPAEFAVRFASPARKVQALAGAKYELRAMYTEGVVRSAAERADFHVGLKARPNSLSGYSLNLPAPGSAAPAGAPRLRFAQHPVTDDPVFPSLADGTKMLNPTTSQSVYPGQASG